MFSNYCFQSNYANTNTQKSSHKLIQCSHEHIKGPKQKMNEYTRKLSYYIKSEEKDDTTT